MIRRQEPMEARLHGGILMKTTSMFIEAREPHGFGPLSWERQMGLCR